MWSHDPLLKFLEPPNISRTVEASSNLARRRTAVSSNEKCKIRSKGVMWRSRDPLLDSSDYVFSLWARLYRSQHRKGTGPCDI